MESKQLSKETEHKQENRFLRKIETIAITTAIALGITAGGQNNAFAQEAISSNDLGRQNVELIRRPIDVNAMASALESAGFTAVTERQSMAKVSSPAVMFTAYDSKAYQTQGGNVLVMAMPLNYQFLDWTAIDPTHYTYRDSSYNTQVGTINYNFIPSGKFFGGTSSGFDAFTNGVSGFYTWKELVPEIQYQSVIQNPPKTVIDVVTIGQMVTTLEKTGFTNVVQSTAATISAPAVMFEATDSKAYPTLATQSGKVFVFALPLNYQILDWTEVNPTQFAMRDSSYNTLVGNMNFNFIPSGKFFGGLSSGFDAFTGTQSGFYTFKEIIPEVQYQSVIQNPPQAVTNSTTIEQMVISLQNAGFTDVAQSSAMASVSAPAVMFEAYDSKAYPTHATYGSKVLVFALPLNYQYQVWTEANPTQFEFRDSNYNSLVGTINFKPTIPATEWFGGTSSGFDAFVNGQSGFYTWKELVPKASDKFKMK